MQNFIAYATMRDTGNTPLRPVGFCLLLASHEKQTNLPNWKVRHLTLPADGRGPGLVS